MRRASSALSTQRLAVLTAVSTHNMIGNQTVSYYNTAGNSSSSSARGSGHHHQGLQTLRPGANMHGNVNVMLGGAMLSVVITVLCFVCYCCHRNIKKRSNSIYRQQWLENEANMEIYSVEQCYDTPSGYGPSPVGIDDNGVNSVRCGSYFMETGPGNEYQPIPATAAAVSAVQVQQHPHQYSHHFNGPPPSYDAVLAQDELAATSKSRPKSSDLCSTVSSDGGEASPRGLSAKLERLLNDPTGNQRRKRMEPDFTDLGRMIGLPGCDEIGNCSCPLSDSLQVYCRKCGQYVDGGLVQNHLNNNQLLGCEESTTGRAGDECGGGNTNWTGSTAIGCDNLMDCDDGDNNGNCIQITNSDNGITYRSISGSALNELLLQDLQFHSTDDTATAATGELDNHWSCCTGRDDSRHNEENNNNLPSSASLPPLVVISGGTIPVDGSAVGGAFVPADTGSNNANSPNNNGNHDSAQATVEVGAGPNGDEGNKPTDNDGDTFRNLTENGLVRLDMSQIIDQTGLPTYEAALRLESSGYV